MSLTFAETPRGTPAALRADSQGRLDESWDYTPVSATGTVHTGPCVVAGFTPVALFAPIYLRLRDGTGPAGQIFGKARSGNPKTAISFSRSPLGARGSKTGCTCS